MPTLLMFGRKGAGLQAECKAVEQSLREVQHRLEDACESAERETGQRRAAAEAGLRNKRQLEAEKSQQRDRTIARVGLLSPFGHTLRLLLISSACHTLHSET